VRVELTVSHTPSANHTKLDHDPAQNHKTTNYTLNLTPPKTHETHPTNPSTTPLFAINWSRSAGVLV
jgi:hypothetical protein